MASVDDRVVRMEFDNASFERKIATTLASIGQLNKALKFEGAGKGLAEVSTATSKFDVSHMGRGIEDVSKKFLALSTIAITTIASITARALQAGAQIAKAFTVAPIIEGFKEYETQLNSVQTILANTASKGTNLNQVTEALDKLNKYSDQTIYNFGQMARNIGTFTAAGVDLDTSVNAIKGIANLAAMSGSSADQASSAMYQLSQAMASGSLKAMDWISVVNAGMAGEAFQSSLFETAKALKTVKDVPIGQSFNEWKDAGGNFKDLMSEGAFTADVLSLALEGFTGDLDEATLVQRGYTEAQAAQIVKTAAIAKAAATEVKTFTQLLGTVKEAVGTGWADSFKIIVGNFTEAKALWTGVNNSIGAFVMKNADARNALLQGWKDLGGRNVLIMSLGAAFKNLGEILAPISKAFREVFPPLTAQRLFDLTKGFSEFAAALKPSVKTVENVKSIFTGLFGVMEIGWTVIKETAKFITGLFSSLGGGSGAFLETAGSIGDFLTKLNDVLVEGGGITKFFETLTEVVQKPIDFINSLKDSIVDFFSVIGSNAPDVASSAIGRLSDRAQGLKDIFDKLGGLWEPLGNALSKIVEVLDKVWDIISAWFKELGQKIAATMEEGDFNAVLDALNTALLGGIAALLAKFIKSGFTFDIGGGMFDKIGQSFEQLTGVLQAMQTNIKANALLKIAGAIAILTASVLVLSMIDSVALTKALTAMAIGFGQLMATFAIFGKLTAGPLSAASFTIMSAGLILLSTAILILSVAVKNLAELDWSELTRGMTALTGLLILLTVASIPLSLNAAGMVRAGIGIAAMSIGLLILGAAMKVFATMDWGEIGKGLVTIAGLLVVIGLAMHLMPSTLPITAAGLILVGIALNILAGALKLFAMMDWGEIGKGLVAIAGALVVIGLAMHLMPLTLPITAAGLILVGIALGIIAKAMESFAGMSWAEIGRGLAGMAGALIILAAAAYAMQGTILGAVAIGILAVSLGVLFKVVESFAGLSWGDLLHGLLGLAAALLALALLSLLISPLIGTMFALGIALTSIGVGFALFGVGAMLVGKALESIAKSGKAAAEAIPAILSAIGESIPALFKGFAQGIVDLIMVFAKAAPILAEAIGVLLEHLMDTIVKLIPKFVKVFDEFTNAALVFLNAKAPLFIDAGIKLLVHLLEGISANIDHITDLVSEIITKFLESLADHIEEIVAAGLKLLSDLLNGIAENLHLVTEAMGNIVTSFIAAVATYYVNILQAGVDLLVKFIEGIASAIWQIVAAGANMIIQLIVGIGQKALEIIAAATWVITQFIVGIGNMVQTLINVGVWVIVKVIEGIGSAATQIATAAATAIGQFITAIGNLIVGDKKGTGGLLDKGVDLVKRILQGVGDTIVDIATAMADFVIDVLNELAKVVREKDTEIRDAGANLMSAIINGMTFGLSDKVTAVGKTLGEKLNGAVSTAKGFLKVVGDPYSRVTMSIGEAMVNGITMAIDADTGVENAAVGLVTRSAAIFENSLNKITESLGSIEEFNPTITPVLDLTRVAADASKISDYIQSSEAIAATVSYNQARVIAADTNVIAESSGQKSPAGTSEIKFEQIINAPTQLSTSDIYKQTRNQITMAKEELSIP